MDYSGSAQWVNSYEIKHYILNPQSIGLKSQISNLRHYIANFGFAIVNCQA